MRLVSFFFLLPFLLLGCPDKDSGRQKTADSGNSASSSSTPSVWVKLQEKSRDPLEIERRTAFYFIIVGEDTVLFEIPFEYDGRQLLSWSQIGAGYEMKHISPFSSGPPINSAGFSAHVKITKPQKGDELIVEFRHRTEVFRVWGQAIRFTLSQEEAMRRMNQEFTRLKPLPTSFRKTR